MKIVNIAVFSILIIALLSAITIPLTMQMTDEIKSVENNEGAKFNLMDLDGEEVVLENINNVAHINGKQLLDIINENTPAYVISDKFILRSMFSNDNMYSWDLIEYSTGTSVTITKLTVNEDGYAWTSNTSSGSGTLSYLWYPDKNGDYIGVKPTSSNPVFVNNDATIYTVETGTNDNILWKVCEGTVNNMTVEYSSDNSTTAPSMVKESVQDNLTRIDSVTYSGTFNILMVSERYYEVTAMDSMLRVLLNLAPLLIGIMFFAAMGISTIREAKN